MRIGTFSGWIMGIPGKEAVIKFLLEFGKERKEYNLKTMEPVMWAFINGFDEGFGAGLQKAWTTWEAWAKENKIRLVSAERS